MTLALKTSARVSTASKLVALAPLVDGTTATLPLTSPMVANGNGGLTFARNSIANVTLWDGLEKEVLSGEIKVENGRRVENLISASESIIGWPGTSTIVDFETVTFSPGEQLYKVIGGDASNDQFLTHVDIKIVSGGPLNVVQIFGQGAGTDYTRLGVASISLANLSSTSWTRVVSNLVDPLGTSLNWTSGVRPGLIAAGSNSSDITLKIRRIFLEKVTGQSNQNPSEHVSVGVLSAPYHGFGVDGVSYFLHQNGNTVLNNVVTEVRGADITGAYTRLEPAATNIALQNRDFTQAVWAKTNITAAKDATGINGVPNSASTLTAIGANGTCFQTITAASAERNNSYYVKRKTGTGTVEITDNGGTNYTAITINSSTFTRVDITRTQANPVIGFRIVTSGDEIEVDYAQTESGSVPTSPIETGSGTATRIADNASYPDTGNFNDSQGSCYVELTPKWNSADISAIQYIIGIDSAASAKLLYIDATNGKIETTDGTNTVADSTALVDGTTYKIALSWFGTTLSLTVNGTTTTGTFSGSWSPDGVYIGNNNGSNEINAGIGGPRFWPLPLSDAERERMTT